MSGVALRLLVVVALVECAAATLQRVFLRAECPDVDVDALRRAAEHARIDIHVYFSREHLLSMQLFSSARVLAAEERRLVAAASSGDADPTTSAYVFADCASRLVGFDFSDYLVGMDCGRASALAAMTEVDALDDRQAFSIALERVVNRIDGWHSTEACRVWGNDSMRAAFFWALVGCIVYAVRSRCSFFERRSRP